MKITAASFRRYCRLLCALGKRLSGESALCGTHPGATVYPVHPAPVRAGQEAERVCTRQVHRRWSASIDPAQMRPQSASVAPKPAPLDPTVMMIGVATGAVPLKLSTWMRMCCVLHTTVFELVALPVFVTGMQITEGMRRRFPAWSVLRALCLAHRLDLI